MLTKELIAQIAATTGISKTLTEDMLSALTTEVRDALMESKAVTIQGLGTWEVKQRNERINVHPKTGERQLIPAKMQVGFKPVTTLKNRYQNQDKEA